jgi:hypothetical protein
MDDCLCMYQDSPGRLRRMDYYNRVEGFINYALSNMRNISGGGIRCLFKRFKNKKFLDLDVVTMHLLQKKVHEKNTCIGLHTENHMFLTRPRYKGWLGQLLIRAICMEL